MSSHRKGQWTQGLGMGLICPAHCQSPSETQLAWLSSSHWQDYSLWTCLNHFWIFVFGTDKKYPLTQSSGGVKLQGREKGCWPNSRPLAAHSSRGMAGLSWPGDVLSYLVTSAPWPHSGSWAKGLWVGVLPRGWGTGCSVALAPAAPLKVLLETSRGHERLWRKKGKSPTVSRRHATCTGRRKSEEAIRETGQHQPATVPGKESLICVYRLRRSQRKEMDESSRAGTFQMRRRASW